MQITTINENKKAQIKTRIPTKYNISNEPIAFIGNLRQRQEARAPARKR